MVLDINKYCKPSKKKRTLLQVLKIKWYAYNKQADRKDRERKTKSNNNIESQNTIVALFTCGFAICMLFLFLGHLKTYLDYNFFYSISKPIIYGDFIADNNYVKVYGVQDLVDSKDSIATLNITEFNCFISDNYCVEERANLSGLGNQVTITSSFAEYKITYKDKDRILFSNFLGDITGEVDLNFKTVTFIVKNAGFNKETRKYVILTDNKKIEELEQKIIKKYLRKRFW